MHFVFCFCNCYKSHKFFCSAEISATVRFCGGGAFQILAHFYLVLYIYFNIVNNHWGILYPHTHPRNCTYRLIRIFIEQIKYYCDCSMSGKSKCIVVVKGTVLVWMGQSLCLARIKDQTIDDQSSPIPLFGLVTHLLYFYSNKYSLKCVPNYG